MTAAVLPKHERREEWTKAWMSEWKNNISISRPVLQHMSVTRNLFPRAGVWKTAETRKHGTEAALAGIAFHKLAGWEHSTFVKFLKEERAKSPPQKLQVEAHDVLSRGVLAVYGIERLSHMLSL